MKFRVVVDATPILPKPSGVGLHLINLIDGLYKLQNSENFELGLTYQPSLKNWFLQNRSLPEALQVYPKVHFLPLPVRVLNLLATVPRNPILDRLERGFGAPDIYHGTNYAVFPCRRSLRVMTIYDLAFLRYPQYVTAVVRTYKARVKQCLQWTDMVITSAESSKAEIIEFLKVPADRIWVTPLASRYSSGVYPAADPALLTAAKTYFDLSQPYILFVSTLEPRKNVVSLIQAFNHLKADLKVEHHLVLIGQPGWQYGPILREIAASPWQHCIHRLGYLSDELTALFYQHADVFAYPSFYEGFGLPVLEAMTLGCPVVTSNRSSLPEVVGDAALMVNPDDVDDLAAALERVIGDRPLRQTLIERGRARAAQFSWNRTALETLKAYRSLL